MLTVADLNTVWNVDCATFSAMVYTLNVVRKSCYLSLYLNICKLRTDPRKLFIGVLESPCEGLDFLSVKEWGPFENRRKLLARNRTEQVIS